MQTLITPSEQNTQIIEREKPIQKIETSTENGKGGKSMSLIEQQMSDFLNMIVIQAKFIDSINQQLGMNDLAPFKDLLKKLEKAKINRESVYNEEIKEEKEIEKEEVSDNNLPESEEMVAVEVQKEKFENIDQYFAKLDNCLSEREIARQSDNGKLRVLETILISQNLDIKQRIKKEECVAMNIEVKERVDKLSEKISLMADKESLTQIKKKLESVSTTLDQCILKEEAEDKIKEESQMVRDHVNEIYTKKDYVDHNFYIVSEEINQQIKKLENIIEEKEQESQQQFKSLNIVVSQKAEQKHYLQLKEFCRELVKKEELKEQTVRINNILDWNKQEFERVNRLQKFLEQTDEAILFKATRMDLEVALQDMKNVLATKKSVEENRKNLQEQLIKTQEDMKNLIIKTAEQTRDDLQQLILKDIKEIIKIEVAKYFIRFDLNQMEKVLMKITETLPKKVDISQMKLLQLENRKKDKFNEKLIEQINCMQIIVRQLSMVTCFYLRSSSSDSTPPKQQELMIKTISQIEQLIDQLTLSQSKFSSLQSSPRQRVIASQNNSPDEKQKTQQNSFSSNLMAKSNKYEQPSYTNTNKQELLISSMILSDTSPDQQNNSLVSDHHANNITPNKRGNSALPQLNNLYTSMSLPLEGKQRIQSPFLKQREEKTENNNTPLLNQFYGNISRQKKFKQNIYAGKSISTYQEEESGKGSKEQSNQEKQLFNLLPEYIPKPLFDQQRKKETALSIIEDISFLKNHPNLQGKARRGREEEYNNY